MKPQLGIIFDFDGVITNSISHALRGVNNVCVKSGVPEITLTQFVRTFHAPYIEKYRNLGITVPVEDIEKWYHEEAKHLEAFMFPDVAHVLSHYVTERSAVIGIVTAQHAHIVKELCCSYGVAQYVSYVAGRVEDKVESLIDFCREHDLSRNNTWFIGDFPSDMRDGKIAGLRCIGITRGHPTRDLLFEAGAERCVEHLFELPELL